MSHGNIHWTEYVSADVGASKKFFTEVVGWEINEMPMPNGPYNICMAGGVPVAGIMGVEQIEADHEIHPHWMTYIAVDDVDAAAANVSGAGGNVIRAPFDIPGVGRIAIITDPGQGVCGIMTPALQD